MRQGQKVDFGVFIGQASFREPKELNPGDRFIQLDKHYDGPVALPPASGLSLPGLPIRSATKRACHAVDGRERSRGKLVQSQGLSPRSSAGLLFGSSRSDLSSPSPSRDSSSVETRSAGK